MSPGENGMKWMSLGQLCAAKEAMHCYRNGISVLERDPEANRAELVRAYCASAELYMTDLCFEADAEKGCEAFLEKAIKLDSDNAEALSAMASLRLSQVWPRSSTPYPLIFLSPLSLFFLFHVSSFSNPLCILFKLLLFSFACSCPILSVSSHFLTSLPPTQTTGKGRKESYSQSVHSHLSMFAAKHGNG